MAAAQRRPRVRQVAWDHPDAVRPLTAAEQAAGDFGCFEKRLPALVGEQRRG